MKPTELQIRNTIQDIKKRLKDPLMDKPANKPVKEGYTEIVNILVEGRKPMKVSISCLRYAVGPLPFWVLIIM
ncbi:hypothetical protein GO755_26475 [Spirosoma sp. HMF4905]|uniref:Uncharacterized protein n=1 Tax=Spirosoma arboris TaxID=2682092 RepID=A0A7K1SII5_9BACT|nr:hypothetical protein [Spirosoma arboris]MVM33612.1 hypothetical protein [Spirosoma arboris]